jgi:hypothetical protein
MKNSFSFLAVAFLVSVSAQGLQGQKACTIPYDVETRLAQLGITLPPVSQPVANYVQAVRAGKLIFLAGTVQTRWALRSAHLKSGLSACLTAFLRRNDGQIVVCEPFTALGV